ncbi:MAG: UDP-N-acetylmuramate--L-alanine ligase [Acidobacteria bacterium]|nr:MAG: UDP-N-acetylmuramate--L-alanine ligase [Acidobacteriota bacterium]
MFPHIQTIHFIGIGGIGMSGIAEILLSLGYGVSGSDLADNATTARLVDLGAKVFKGHRPDQVGDADVVVTSTAIKADNPEVIAARYRNIPIIPRAEMLAELMRMKHGIAVAGAHGKTSTTSMLAHILCDTDLDPTVVIGGRLNKFNSNAKLGKGDYMLVEADESDGSFMKLNPTISIVTNLDEEHLDHYKGGMQEIEQTFLAFMNKVPFYGLVVLCSDDERLKALIPGISRRVVTYGLYGDADLTAANIRHQGFGMTFDLMVRGKAIAPVSIRVPGIHNVLNSLAAIAVALEFNVPIDSIVNSITKFTGADRRFHQIGTCRERFFVDDYAHHPTEIKATLEAAKQAYPGGLVAVFQPHRYSRFSASWEKLLHAFDCADHVVVVPVYEAGETPVPNIHSSRFAEELREKHASVSYLDDLKTIDQHLEKVSSQGEMILALGAGSISKTIRDVHEKWRREDELNNR